MADDGLVRLIAAAAYAVAALITGWASRTSQERERRFWIAAAATFLLLGVAKQWEIQGHLTQWLRELMRHTGWYESHRGLQTAFVVLLALLSAVAAALISRWLRPCRLTVKVAGACLGILLAFLAIRTASIHSVDVWTTVSVGGMRRGWWLELLAAACISACAAVYAAGMTKRSTLVRRTS